MNANFITHIQEMLVEGLIWLALISAYALAFMYLFYLATDLLSS